MTPAEKTRILAERVMGWEVQVTSDGVPVAVLRQDGYEVLMYLGITVWPGKTWDPLTNLSHAGEVLEAMAKKGWSARIATNACDRRQNGCEFFRDYLGLGNNIFSGNYSKYGSNKRVSAVTKTIPTAICHAALLAEGVKEEEL